MPKRLSDIPRNERIALGVFALLAATAGAVALFLPGHVETQRVRDLFSYENKYTMGLSEDKKAEIDAKLLSAIYTSEMQLQHLAFFNEAPFKEDIIQNASGTFIKMYSPELSKEMQLICRDISGRDEPFTSILGDALEDVSNREVYLTAALAIRACVLRKEAAHV